MRSAHGREEWLGPALRDVQQLLAAEQRPHVRKINHGARVLSLYFEIGTCELFPSFGSQHGRPAPGLGDEFGMTPSAPTRLRGGHAEFDEADTLVGAFLEGD